MHALRIAATVGLVGILYAPAAMASGELQIQTIEFVPVSAQQDVQTTSLMPSLNDALSRVQFVSMVVDRLYTTAQIDNCYWTIGSTKTPRFTHYFNDVSTRSLHAGELCVALRDGLARGYDDGTFRPNRSITFEEASKILARAYGLVSDGSLKGDLTSFRPYMETLAQRHAIPMTINGFHHRMKFGEGSDMLARIADGVTWMPSRTYAELERMTKPVRLPLVQSDVPPRSAIGTKSSAASSGSSSSAVPWYKFF